MNSEKLDKKGCSDIIAHLKEALQTLSKVSLKARDVFTKLNQTLKLEDQCEILTAKGASVVKSPAHSHEIRAVTSPKLGGGHAMARG